MLITAQSIPNNNWSCYEFITWFDKLRDYYDKDTAKQVFIAGWNEYGDFDCQLDEDFVSYFNRNGIDIQSTGAAIITSVSGLGEDMWNIVVTPFETLSATLGIGKKLAPVMLVFVAGMAGWIIYKTVKETSGREAISLAATRGLRR